MKDSLFFKILVNVVLGVAFTVPTQAQDARTWRGKWNNRKFGTSGPLQCVAFESSPGNWNGTFTGTFQGDPFEYKVSFQSEATRRGALLSGKSTISGHQYQWSGEMRANQLSGEYRNNVGYYGTFELTDVNRGSSRDRNTGGGNEEMLGAPEGPPSKVRWDPAIGDGERLLFIGNSFIANEGGVQNYFAKAAKKAQLTVTTDQIIEFGKPLKSMLKPEVAKKIDSDLFDSVVITSGELKVMKQFASRIKREGKKTIVLMTWEPQHPGNRSTEKRYTSATRKAIRQMRTMEKDTGAIIVPSAVVFHDLTIRPPSEMPRVDYLWREKNIHQNELGTLVNAWMLYAILTGESPVGNNFNMPPYVVGQKLAQTPEITLTRDLRLALQQRVWKVAQAWKSGQSHLE